MRVHLRQRRQKNGKISLYLEIYKGYLKTNNKTKAIRDYEYLNLYLYNKPSGFIQKKHKKKLASFFAFEAGAPWSRIPFV